MKDKSKEKLPAIETLPPITGRWWLPDAGPVTIYRLKQLTPQEIEEHGLTQYVIGGEQDERGMDA